MPSVKALVHTFTSEAVVGELVSAANANTPSGTIPRATVDRDASGKVVAVHVNLPVGIAKSDFVNAMAAINANSGVATATPAGIQIDSNGVLAGLPVGPLSGSTLSFDVYGTGTITTDGVATITTAAAEALVGSALSFRSTAALAPAGSYYYRQNSHNISLDVSEGGYSYCDMSMWCKVAATQEGVAVAFPTQVESKSFGLSIEGSFANATGTIQWNQSAGGTPAGSVWNVSLDTDEGSDFLIVADADPARVWTPRLIVSATSCKFYYTSTLFLEVPISGLGDIMSVSYSIGGIDYFLTNSGDSRPRCMDNLLLTLS